MLPLRPPRGLRRHRMENNGTSPAVRASPAASSPDRSLPQTPTQGARPVACDPEPQAEIGLANDVPALAQADGDRRITRNIPAVVFEATDQAIAGVFQESVPIKAADMIFEQNKPRTPANDIEPA